MIAWNLEKNKTISGYIDSQKKKVKFFNDKYPLEMENGNIPFVITRDVIFLIGQKDVDVTIDRFKQQNRFNDIKRKFANILIIPGLLVALIYLLKYVGVFAPIVILETFFNSPFLNIFFWIGVLGVIILWHDYYSSKSPFTTLPKPKPLSKPEIEEILSSGIQFSRYAQPSFSKHISDELLLTLSNLGTEIDLTKMFLGLLENDDILEIFKRAAVETKAFEKVEEKRVVIKRESLCTVIDLAFEEALILNSKEVSIVHLFLALIKYIPALSKILDKNNSSLSIFREVSEYIFEKKESTRNDLFDPLIPYYRTDGIAKSWIYGYTFVLSHFSKDLNEEVALFTDEYGIGHEKEVENLVAILGKTTKRNALLIGDPGVGKSSLIKGIAQRINRGEVPEILQNFKITQLDVNGLIAYSKGKKNTEAIIEKAMHELTKAGNVILYIDEIQELIPAKATEGGHSIAGILLPYVQEGKFPIVGTVNYSDYKKYFYTNESFRQSFTNIEVSELPANDTLKILETIIPKLEKAHKIYITFPVLIACVEYAQRYVTQRMLPDSAVALLEDTCSWAANNEVKLLEADHVAKVVSMQTNISVGDIATDEAERLMTLEERIKERVIGQDEAVRIISESLRRARVDIRDPKKPIGVFLFVGPTGVGKTYLAKVVSQEYFNNSEDIIRVDMSEYLEDQSVNKLLGSYGESERNKSSVTILDKVKTNPYTLVLFDEIEKANPKILNLFLQLFEEGRLTSTSGETIDFTNTIIVCTSNIAASEILKSIEEGHMWEDTKNIVKMQLKQYLKPELLNRFDGVVIFHPQTKDNLVKISDMLLTELAERLKEKNISLDWDSTIPMLIANKAYEPGFGARPIRRYIQEKVEGNIASILIKGEIKSGDIIKVKESWIV